MMPKQISCGMWQRLDLIGRTESWIVTSKGCVLDIHFRFTSHPGFSGTQAAVAPRS